LAPAYFGALVFAATVLCLRREYQDQVNPSRGAVGE
jgi:hypothetical protein